MKRLFITELDTALGRRVTERFGLAKEYHITGTLRPHGIFSAVASDQQHQQLLPFVSSISPSYATDAVEFKRLVLESDVIICTLTDSTLEAEAAIKMLAHTTFETEKTFVLISSTMTWTNTFAAQRAEELAEKRRERQELIDAGEEVPPEEDEPEPAEEDLPVFTDDQYQKRVPHARYQHWRDLEHLTKAANSETLHTHVIFSGVTYGRGEEDGSVLHDWFRSAWHAQSLVTFTSGSNVVPMIHIDDLAHLIFKVGSSNDLIAQRYMLGVDRGNCTMGAIVKAINDALGSGKTHILPPSQWAVTPGIDRFVVDLRMEPGAAFEQVEDAEWVSAEGFVANIDKITEEYKKFRHVTPIRSVIIGLPMAGKSTVASTLAQRYRVQHLTVSDIITSYEANLTNMRNALADARASRKEAKRLAALAALEAEAAERAAEAAAAAAAAGDDGAIEGGDQTINGDEGDEKRGDDAGDDAKKDGQAVADDVSDIDFDDDQQIRAASALAVDASEVNDGEGGGAPPAAAEEAAADDAADAADPDEDEDERIAKLKEDISAADKVMLLRRKTLSRFDPNSAATGEEVNAEEVEAADDAAGDDAAAEDDSRVAAPQPENPFLRLRYIDEALATMTRWRISQKDCKNQGYVLDGFPKTVRQATLTFSSNELTLPEPEDLLVQPDQAAENEEPEGALNPVDEKLFPEVVFVLSIDDAHIPLLLSRAVDEAKDITKEFPGHNSVANLLRRLGEYKKNHTKSNRPQRSLPYWWKSVVTAVEPPAAPRAASLAEYDASRFQGEMEDMMGELYNTLGEPHFYRPTPQDIRQAAKDAQARAEAVRLDTQRKEEAALQEAKRLEDIARQENQKHKRRYETVQREQQEANILKQLPAQEYLMRFVVPALTAGMEKTTQLRPEDPLDALAEYLFAYSARTQL